MDWPNKEDRENFEINEFIKNFKNLPNGREFKIINKREKPDFFVEDTKTNEYFGVELTSVYKSDRSVPDEHINSKDKNTPFNREEIEKYKERIIEAIKSKVKKAQKHYDLRYPLILSVYVNEYCSIFMNRNEWQSFVDNNGMFDLIEPFSGVFFWDLANGDALLVTPNKKV